MSNNKLRLLNIRCTQGHIREAAVSKLINAFLWQRLSSVIYLYLLLLLFLLPVLPLSLLPLLIPPLAVPVLNLLLQTLLFWFFWLYFFLRFLSPTTPIFRVFLRRYRVTLYILCRFRSRTWSSAIWTKAYIDINFPLAGRTDLLPFILAALSLYSLTFR